MAYLARLDSWFGAGLNTGRTLTPLASQAPSRRTAEPSRPLSGSIRMRSASAVTARGLKQAPGALHNVARSCGTRSLLILLLDSALRRFAGPVTSQLILFLPSSLPPDRKSGLTAEQQVLEHLRAALSGEVTPEDAARAIAKFATGVQQVGAVTLTSIHARDYMGLDCICLPPSGMLLTVNLAAWSEKRSNLHCGRRLTSPALEIPALGGHVVLRNNNPLQFRSQHPSSYLLLRPAASCPPWRRGPTNETTTACQVEDFAQLDPHRAERSGLPEVVWGPGKTPAQIATILQSLARSQGMSMATRIEPHVFDEIQKMLPGEAEDGAENLR